MFVHTLHHTSISLDDPLTPLLFVFLNYLRHIRESLWSIYFMCVDVCVRECICMYVYIYLCVCVCVCVCIHNDKSMPKHDVKILYCLYIDCHFSWVGIV